MSEERPSITWDRPKLERFKRAYAYAQGGTFIFEGHEFVKDYAKYLIEYLETQLPKGEGE